MLMSPENFRETPESLLIRLSLTNRLSDVDTMTLHKLPDSHAGLYMSVIPTGEEESGNGNVSIRSSCPIRVALKTRIALSVVTKTNVLVENGRVAR